MAQKKENMTLKESIEYFRFMIENHWKNKPTKTTEKAINTLIEHYNYRNDIILQNNDLFAKCYVMLFAHQLAHFKDINRASREVEKLLIESPLSLVYEKFLNKLNDVEREMYFKEIGLQTTKHPRELTEPERLKENEILKKNEKAFKENVLKWKASEVYERLDSDIIKIIEVENRNKSSNNNSK
ncbi:hypothetical protein [Bizionia sp.]|uniref:hypothetical protein n=1 Tax=Bizionia sp. TaxID=1954480 RepID=UPI003A8EC97B